MKKAALGVFITVRYIATASPLQHPSTPRRRISNERLSIYTMVTVHPVPDRAMSALQSSIEALSAAITMPVFRQ